MKIVYNDQYGGYGLSIEALTLFIQRVENPERYEWDNPAYDRGIESQYNASKIPRHHPILVEVVEELGDAASGDHATLAIGHARRLYRIGEYDGNEWVITPEDEHDWYDAMRDDTQMVRA